MRGSSIVQLTRIVALGLTLLLSLIGGAVAPEDGEAAPAVIVTLTITPHAGGTITSNPSGINCGSDCSESRDVTPNNPWRLTLTATPAQGWRFGSWGNAPCVNEPAPGDPVCDAFIDRDRTISPTFIRETYRLTVTRSGSGSGRVTGPGIDCPTDCVEDFRVGDTAPKTLTATPNAGSVFAGWGGACSGFSSTCSVTMTADRTVTATFNATLPPPPPPGPPPPPPGPPPPPVATPAGEPSIGGPRVDPLPPLLPKPVEQVIVKVDGSGNVTSAPAARTLAAASAPRRINCGVNGFECYGEYRPGEALTLTAKPAAGYAFKRWTGSCSSSTATCQVVATDARTVTAVFEAKGTGAAVGATLRAPRLKVRWLRSVGAGTLVVQGSTTAAARARIDMRRPGGGPLATLQLPVPGGTFRQILSLRQGALSGGAKVFPGGFVVALTGSSGKLKLPLQVQTIAIPAPVEGVVRQAFKSETEQGRRKQKLRAGTPEAWAHFRFETQPRMTKKLTVHWFKPNGEFLGKITKSNRPVIKSYLRLPSGLPSGRWVAQLKVGNKVIQTLSVPVG